MSTRRCIESKNEFSESGVAEDEAVEKSESDETACKNVASDGPGSVENPVNNATENSSRVEEAPVATEEDGLFEPNPKESCVDASKSPEISEMAECAVLNDHTTKIHVVEIEAESNLAESKPENFLTSLIEEESMLDAKEPKTRPQLMDFLSLIFRWNPKWLAEHRQLKTTPPVVDKRRLTAMLPRYESFEHYYEIVEPLLVLEMWHAISDDYKVRRKNFKKFAITPLSLNWTNVVKPNVSTLNLEIVVSKKDLQLGAHPSHGDLLFLDYFSNRRDKYGLLKETLFAYVTGLRKRIIRHKSPTTMHDPHTIIMITAMTRGVDSEDIRMYRVDKLQKIMYIRSNIRMVQALQQLHASPLMNMILHPKIEDYQLLPANDVEEYHLVTKNVLNKKQLEAVMRVTETVFQRLPKICLIQGPPGTGKSRVITNLVMQILHDKRRFEGFEKLKILVCAPSNTAIDSIVIKLLEMQQSLDVLRRFCLVRIGCTNTMHPKAKEVSLEELSNQPMIINEYWSSLDKRSRRTRFPARRPREVKNWLLQNADVIASTLTSCYMSDMEFAFANSPGTSLVCIVDEASQCTEPESLIPLMLGIKTLILVGDANQLPATVLSRKAKHLGLDRSLFARIEHVFKDTPNNPLIQLDVQYRMSVPVARFPNKYFYGGALKNAAIMHKLPVHAYRVIDLDSTQDFLKFSNSDEAEFVAYLIYTMIDRTNYGDAVLPVKVGIITPYQKQKILLTKKIEECIEHLEDKNKIHFEVNTVDSFQGQERDVIIMSCVRSSGIGFLSDPHRLCVALTRARHSMIICGNFKTFEKDPMWNALLTDAKSRGVYVYLKSTAHPEEIRRHIIR